MQNDCFTLAELLEEYTSSIKQCLLVFTPTWKYSNDVSIINGAWDFYKDKMPLEIYTMIKNSDWGFLKFPNFDLAIAHAEMYFPYRSQINAVNPKFMIDCMIYDEEGKLAWTNEL